MTWDELVQAYGEQAALILIKSNTLNLQYQHASLSQNQLSQMQELQRQQMLNQGMGQFLGQSPLLGSPLTATHNPFASLPQHVAPAPLETGTKVEDLIGYRIWRLTGAGMLQSYSAGSIWLPGQPMTGEPGDHDSVGVWAFKDKTAAIKKISDEKTVGAAGSVRLWGQVVEHEHGYRAQFARIVSIDSVSLPGKFPWDHSQIRALKWLRQTYGVEA